MTERKDCIKLFMKRIMIIYLEILLHFRANNLVSIFAIGKIVCRVKANPKNAINEKFLPRFLDFIVWGHEHECLVDPQVSMLPFYFSMYMHDIYACYCHTYALGYLLFIKMKD